MLSPSCINAGAALPRRCLVVDDDPTAIQLILQCIVRLPSLQVVGTCSSAVEALVFLQQQPVDLLFLDIMMPLVSGLELLHLLLHQLPRLPHTILVTSSTTHAAEAFDYAVVDYLLKPISFARFAQAIDKVELLLAKTLATSCLSATAIPNVFFIKGIGHKMTRIDLDEVHYFEASKSYVSIVMEHKTLTISCSLRELQNRLPANLFAPIHRSFLVNIRLIDSIGPDVVLVKNKELPVSLPHRAALLKCLHVLN